MKPILLSDLEVEGVKHLFSSWYCEALEELKGLRLKGFLSGMLKEFILVLES